MLHQSHLRQLPRESLQPEKTCSNSWATRRMISLPAEGNKDKVTWISALGAGENGIPELAGDLTGHVIQCYRTKQGKDPSCREGRKRLQDTYK